MAKVRDITGQRFGLLVALDRQYRKGKSRWRCACDCGNESSPSLATLVSGQATSCGCQQYELIAKSRRKHGDYLARLYKIWAGMIKRCRNRNATFYSDYGGRGISVCDAWLSYPEFKAWALSAGYNDTLSIDRIDNDGNYEPSNCRWATSTEQGHNRRNTPRFMFQGQTGTITELSRQVGINVTTVKARIKAGWPLEDALSRPPSPFSTT